MKWNKIFIVFVFSLFLPFLTLKERQIISKGFDQKQTSINPKLENPNNHPLVDYNDSNHISGSGNRIDAEFVADLKSEKILIDEGNTFFKFKIKDGYDLEDVEIDHVYFTLYEVKDDKYNEIANYQTDKIWKENWSGPKNQL